MSQPATQCGAEQHYRLVSTTAVSFTLSRQVPHRLNVMNNVLA